MDKQDSSVENLAIQLTCDPQVEKFKILNFAISKVDSNIDFSVLKANIQCEEINWPPYSCFCVLFTAFRKAETVEKKDSYSLHRRVFFQLS